MIHERDKELFADLIEKLKSLCNDNITFLKIEINCEQTIVTANHSTPSQLTKSSFSMRNIKGDFIR